MLCKKVEKDFLDILEEELIPAMGCTEPIALAFVARGMNAFVLNYTVKPKDKYQPLVA